MVRRDRRWIVSVIGGHKCDSKAYQSAEKIGKIIAEENAILVTGGLSGIMEAASRGCKLSGGTTIGIIPGEDKNDANEYVDVVIPTGMGYSRNVLVAGCADIVIALPGKYGTLSEIGFALNSGKTVYGLNTWDIEGVHSINSPEEFRQIIKKMR